MIQALALLKSPKVITALVVIAATTLLVYGVKSLIENTHQRGYELGLAEGKITMGDAQLQAELKRAEAQSKLIKIERAMRQLEIDAAKRIADARSDGEVQVKTVERVIRENPTFADLRRPPELKRVRDDQLAAIAAAAARGAAAAELSGASVRTLPSASHNNRR